MRNFFSVFFVLFFSLFSVSEQAQALELKDIQVYAETGITYYHSDIQGTVASGGDIKLSNFAFNSFNRPNQNIYGAGYFELVDGSVFGAVYCKNYIRERASIEGGIWHIRPGEEEFVTNTLPRKLKMMTEDLSQMGSSRVYFANGEIQLPAEGPVTKFKLSQAQFEDAWGLRISANDSNQIVVVEVSGEDISFTGKQIELQGANRDRVLFVFPEARRLTISTSGDMSRNNGIQASILAIYADVVFTQGLLSGGLYVRSLHGPTPGGQINPGQFTGWDDLHEEDDGPCECK